MPITSGRRKPRDVQTHRRTGRLGELDAMIEDNMRLGLGFSILDLLDERSRIEAGLEGDRNGEHGSDVAGFKGV